MAFISGRHIGPDPRTPAVRQRVVVKLGAGAVPPSEGAGLEAGGADAVWAGLAEQFPGVRVAPYFSAAAGLAADDAAGGPAPPSALPLIDRHRYLAVDVPAEIEADRVAHALRQRPGVETAYREGGPTPPPVNAADDPRSGSQGYLEPAPAGVDARFAWNTVDGTGVAFVDLERGWTLEHQDLVAAGITVISGINTDFRGHGTAVLGEVAASDNAIGCIGVAPAVSTRVVSQWRGPNTYSTGDAILSAASVMQPGDVLLLEAQTTYPTSGDAFVPIEVEDLVFDAIRGAVDRGIIVIEAGANGSVDLDQFQDVNGRQVLNRNSPDFRDSGAIMVGAGSADASHQRLFFSNFGTRIDCFAWGEGINTTGDGRSGDDPSVYMEDFGGTSGASPIVTGCAILLQSERARNGQPPHSPAEMRVLLSDPTLNTASAAPDADFIGVMPDLRAILTREPGDSSGVQPSLAVTED